MYPSGDLVVSDDNMPIPTIVTVEALSGLLVRVFFDHHGKQVSMRAIL